ncbi:MAG: trehalose-phosphatase [Calditrichia bacterium]
MLFKDLPSALQKEDEIQKRLGCNTLSVFLDYDGTLTPIVSRPEDAVLSSEVRSVLRKLAGLCKLAIVSGRDRKDVMHLVDLDQLYYAGSHGFDISGPDGMHMENEGGKKCLPDLEEAEKALRQKLGKIEGAQVERKRFSIAAHFRNVKEENIAEFRQIVNGVLKEHPKLRKGTGKKILELQPDIDWDKGKAVMWLLHALDLDKPDVLPLYIGDDITDEDAFSALSGRGIGILVGDHGKPTSAKYGLKNVPQTREFLQKLIEILEDERS